MVQTLRDVQYIYLKNPVNMCPMAYYIHTYMRFIFYLKEMLGKEAWKTERDFSLLNWCTESVCERLCIGFDEILCNAHVLCNFAATSRAEAIR